MQQAFETAPPSSPKRRAKVFVGVLIVAATVAGLVVWALGRPGSTSFFVGVDELRRLGPTAEGQELRVNGNVVPGSVRRRGVETVFAISSGGATLPVVTDQPLPDAFWTGYENDPDAVEVVARGRYLGRRFAASEVLAKCPSKFRAKV